MARLELNNDSPLACLGSLTPGLGRALDRPYSLLGVSVIGNLPLGGARHALDRP